MLRHLRRLFHAPGNLHEGGCHFIGRTRQQIGIFRLFFDPFVGPLHGVGHLPRRFGHMDRGDGDIAQYLTEIGQHPVQRAGDLSQFILVAVVEVGGQIGVTLDGIDGPCRLQQRRGDGSCQHPCKNHCNQKGNDIEWQQVLQDLPFEAADIGGIHHHPDLASSLVTNGEQQVKLPVPLVQVITILYLLWSGTAEPLLHLRQQRLSLPVAVQFLLLRLQHLFDLRALAMPCRQSVQRLPDLRQPRFEPTAIVGRIETAHRLAPFAKIGDAVGLSAAVGLPLHGEKQQLSVGLIEFQRGLVQNIGIVAAPHAFLHQAKDRLGTRLGQIQGMLQCHLVLRVVAGYTEHEAENDQQDDGTACHQLLDGKPPSEIVHSDSPRQPRSTFARGNVSTFHKKRVHQKPYAFPCRNDRSPEAPAERSGESVISRCVNRYPRRRPHHSRYGRSCRSWGSARGARRRCPCRRSCRHHTAVHPAGARSPAAP